MADRSDITTICGRTAQKSGRSLNTSSFADVDALFPQLHAAGYLTGVFGKIHNDQTHWLCHGPSKLVASFTHVETECDPCGGYYATNWVYKEDDDDVATTFTLPAASYGRAYSHAEYGNRSIAWLTNITRNPKTASRPFFAYVGTTGPHLNAVPAPWHREAVKRLSVRAPRTPNFNQHAPHHNSLLSTAPPLDATAIEYIDQLMRSRWGTLYSIDDLIAGLVHTLSTLKRLDSTYVLVSSDHGYHLGQFRIPDEKMLPYESDVRVPFWIRGPGIDRKAGSIVNEMTINIDIAPTLLELARIEIPSKMDGGAYCRCFSREQKHHQCGRGMRYCRSLRRVVRSYGIQTARGSTTILSRRMWLVVCRVDQSVERTRQRDQQKAGRNTGMTRRRINGACSA